jgi:hypothetical protein
MEVPINIQDVTSPILAMPRVVECGIRLGKIDVLFEDVNAAIVGVCMPGLV